MDLIGDPFRPLQPYIFAAAFALARMLAMMIVFPVFDRLGVTGFIRNSIAVVISIPLIPMIAAHLGGEQLSLGLIAALLLKEVVVGLIVGARIGRAAVCSGGRRRHTRPATRVLVGHPQRPSRIDPIPHHGHTARACRHRALFRFRLL